MTRPSSSGFKTLLSCLGNEGSIDVGVAAGEIELTLPDNKSILLDDDLVISGHQDNRCGRSPAE